MHPRIVANTVYAYLAHGRDAAGRRELDEQLWAPLDGWEATEEHFWSRVESEAGVQP